MKKKFMENKKFRLIAVFLITVFIVGGFSLAWFYVRKSQYNEMSVANFKATPECKFVLPDNSVIDAEKYKDENGLIKLSTIKEDENQKPIENYIGNFRVRVKYEGDGAGYLRVKMVHEFSINGFSAQHTANVPYSLGEHASLWFDNRGNDYCYYYANELDADGNAEKFLDFIEPDGDIDLGNLADGVEIKVAVEADMVQINRYPQIWGITEIPKN